MVPIFLLHQLLFADAKSAGDIQQRKRELEKQIEAVGGQLGGKAAVSKTKASSKKGLRI